MSEHLKVMQKYCDDIIKGRIPSGIYVKKAVKRFLNDLKRQKEPSFGYEFVPEFAEEVIEFAESLQIPDIQRDDGSKNLQLLPWMLFVYYQIWGWRLKTDNTIRRFRYGYCEVARKNSKTTSILFPWVLWDFIETDSAESYFVSADGAQSEKSFKELNYIIKADKSLGQAVSNTVYTITLNHSRIAFFSSESIAIDSYKNSLSIIDEYHSYSSDKIVTAFRYGGRARKNCLTFVITSAGNDISGPCYAEALRCKKILNGAFDDESYFGIIYAYDDEDKWDDPANFVKANPSLGPILKPEILQNDLDDALTLPAHQPDFKAKTCGIWTSATSNWIPLQKWERNRHYELDEETLKGMDCYGSFDLSSVSDFTAFTLYFKLPDGKYYPKHWFYIPEATVYEKYKKDNINIIGWIAGENPLVRIIPGETIDQQVLFEDIKKLSAIYHIQEIAYDRWQSSFLVDKLNQELDITLIEYDQSLKKMAPATKKWEKAILDGDLVDNNPVMAWMLSNAKIKVDANGNYKPLKDYASSTNRIDGVVTSIMAFDRLTENEAKPVQDVSLEMMLASI